MTEEKKETGLVRRERAFTLMPGSLGEAQEMAHLIAGSDFAPKDYKGKPANVIIAVQMGADLGLKPMQALQNIAIINGRPSIYGDGALALVLAAGVLDDFKEFYEGEGDDLTAVCEAKRKGMSSPTRNTFSVKDAKAAALWTKSGPWTNYPKRMLKFRARGFTLRDVASDILLGLVLAEEAMDYPEAINAAVVSVEEAPKPGDLMETIPEAMRDNVEKAFATLHLSAAQRLAKLNEFLGGADVVPEEGATKLLDWCKDEYAKRKTGQPRAPRSNGNAKKTQTDDEARTAAEMTHGEHQAAVQDAEVVEEAPVATTAPADNPRKEGEWF